MTNFLYKKNNVFLISAVTLFVAATLLSACGKKKQAPPPAPPKVVAVAVVQQSIPVIMHFPGTVKEYKKVHIKPRVSGYIEQHKFTEGSLVTKGDLLYQIDPRPFQAKLDAANAQLEQDQSSLDFWNKELKRYNELVKKGSVSKEKRDTTATRQKEFSATINKDKADIEQAQLNLDYTHISAPFDGWIQKTNVYEGAVVSAQTTELTTLIALDPFYVDFNISRHDVNIIQQLSEQGLGAKQRDEISATLTLQDGTLYAKTGYVDYTSAAFNTRTDTMPARAVFSNHNPTQSKSHILLSFIPGQYIPLNLTVGHKPDALLIPQTALQETQLGSFVYVLDTENKVEQRLVTKGVAYKHYWVIETGLKKGEQVISQGLQKIRKPGMQVQPVKADDKSLKKQPEIKQPE